MSSGSEKAAVVCPSCDKKLLVPAASLGKQGRCPVCQSVFTLEQLFEAESAADSPTNQFDALAPASNSWNAPATSHFASSSDQLLTPSPQSNYAALTNAYAAPQVTETSSYQSYETASPPVQRQFWDSFFGGVLMMVIAVVWFFGAAMVGVYFIYPPIMFIIGLVVAIKGLASGNIKGG